ncbi:MAG: SIR2 family protein [Veillonellales bacterium]
MKICNFDEVKNDIIEHLREHRLIPVLGAGFSANSSAVNGKVPSGSDLKEYMIQQVSNKINLTDDKIWDNKTFSQVATYYHSKIDKPEQKKYVRNNFTHVKLCELKCDFLDIDWIYLYTLNFDDAIEECSRYKYVIYSNRDVDFNSLSDEKCVIKLHGDAKTFISYNDDNSQIFDLQQYAKSLKKNISLLKKLEHDFKYNNLVFIGCSLDNEFDIASLEICNDIHVDIHNSEKTSKYYLAITEPDPLKKIDLEQYGITHIVLFDSYNEIYRSIIDAFEISKKIPKEDIDIYKNLPIKKYTSSDYEINAPFLFEGKPILDIESKEIVLPYFFITRTITEKISKNLDKNTIHVVYGARVSGKSYLLAALVQNIRDRNVYYFDSRNEISHEVLKVLFKKENVLLIFDTNSIDKDSIFDLLNRQNDVHVKKNNIVIAVNTSDKDIVSAVNKNERNRDIIGYPLSSKFSTTEINEINKLMSQAGLPNYNIQHTIIDNIIEMAKTFSLEKNYFTQLTPNMKTVNDFVILILFAINEKLSTSTLMNFDMTESCFEQMKKTTPLITEEHTLYFERNIENSSYKKYVINAKYWLYRQLGSYVREKDHYKTIIDAYKYIISIILKQNKKRAYSLIMDYIKIDIINEIFSSEKKGQLTLAKAIYEGLSSLLSENPHFFHQRAKCHWLQSFSSSSIDELITGLRYANIAKHNFLIEYEHRKNEKIEISLEHVNFTIALIYSRINIIIGLDNIEAMQKAISAIYEAIKGQYNRSDFLEIKQKRSSKKNDIQIILESAMKNASALDNKSKQNLEEVIRELNYI